MSTENIIEFLEWISPAPFLQWLEDKLINPEEGTLILKDRIIDSILSLPEFVKAAFPCYFHNWKEWTGGMLVVHLVVFFAIFWGWIWKRAK